MKDDLDDLSARERRGELAPNERRRLNGLLEASLESRFLHQAGCAFDADGKAMPGDDAIAERIAARVITRLNPPARRPHWSLIAAVAACLASVALAAVSNVYLRRDVAAPVERAVANEPDEPSQTAPAEPAPMPPMTKSAPPAPKPPPASASAAKDDAAELFASAARARREGEPQKAMALYAKLQSRFPAAPESRAADMALGMLHLGRGAHAQALDHFERYLKHSPRGELAPEAMWGQAQSLSSLGRKEQARRSLDRLQELYPDSPYAIQARTKLGSESDR